MLAEPSVDSLPELGIVLAKGDGQAAAGAHGDVFVNRDAGEHLAPELGQVVVHDRDRGDAGVDHLEDIVVFEHVGSFVDDHDGLAACFQLRVQLDDAVVIGARRPDEHRLAGQIVDRGNRRRSRPGDDHLAHVGARRLGEGGNRLQFGPDRHHRRDHVHLALQEGWSQQIARHGHDDHMHFEVARLEVRVQIGLEQLEGFERQPALLPPVDEVVRAVERHADAKRAALDDLVEVSGERLVRQVPHRFGEGIHRRGGVRDGRVGRGGACGSRRRRSRRRRRRLLLPTGAGRSGGCQGQQGDTSEADARARAQSIHSRHGRVPVDVAAAGGAVRISHLSAQARPQDCGHVARVRNIEPARLFGGKLSNSWWRRSPETDQPTACRSHLPNGRSSGRLRLRRDWHSGNLHASLAGSWWPQALDLSEPAEQWVPTGVGLVHQMKVGLVGDDLVVCCGLPIGRHGNGLERTSG